MYKSFTLSFILINFILSAQYDSLRLNQIRVLASHNSYKNKPDPKVIRFLTRFKKQLGSANDPVQLDYGHLPLPQQFDEYNIRGIEIDVNYDPNGGLYKKRKLNMFILGKPQKVKDPKMNEPGFKVLHIADVDYETNYLTFISVLTELKHWSELHNPADESMFLKRLGFKKAIPFDEKAFNLLDKEILSILPKDKIFQPENLKKNYSTIKDRIETEGWPILRDCLDKFIFILEGSNDQQYALNNLSRPMFVYGSPSNENTAFVLKNDPLGNEIEILELTTRYIVRTRSDAGTIEARKNDYSRFQSAWKSGAQIISTDYYKPDLRFSTFQIKF
jgi:hypothetical protein